MRLTLLIKIQNTGQIETQEQAENMTRQSACLNLHHRQVRLQRLRLLRLHLLRSPFKNQLQNLLRSNLLKSRYKNQFSRLLLLCKTGTAAKTGSCKARTSTCTKPIFKPTAELPKPSMPKACYSSKRVLSV